MQDCEFAIFEFFDFGQRSVLTGTGNLGSERNVITSQIRMDFLTHFCSQIMEAAKLD